MELLINPYNKKEIPEEYWESSNKWNSIASTWYFRGLKGYTLTLKDMKEDELARQQIGAILSSWDYKHENKIAAVAYLLDLFYYERKDKHARRFAY